MRNKLTFEFNYAYELNVKRIDYSLRILKHFWNFGYVEEIRVSLIKIWETLDFPGYIATSSKKMDQIMLLTLYLIHRLEWVLNVAIAIVGNDAAF